MGRSGKLYLGEKVAVSNTLFNVSSGSIYIDDYTIFGQNVMILTGRHNFVSGCRAGLHEVMTGPGWGGGEEEVPSEGFDIRIGQGCFIASGAIVIGGVEVGKHSIVASGAVVTRSVPEHSIVAGIPATVIGDTRNL